MSEVENIEKKKNWKNQNFWFGMIGVLGTIIGIYTYFDIPKSDLKCTILTNVSIVDLKEDVSKLNITYDSINILKSNQNISMIVLEMKNFGDKNIGISDYDPESPLGLKLSEGIILQKPELIASSDYAYFQNVISSYSNNSLNFRHKIIDNNNFYRVKLLVLHKKEISPKLVSYGKVAGIEKIEIINFTKINPSKKANEFAKLISILAISLISILSLLSLSLYKNNLISYQLVKSFREEIELYKKLLEKNEK